jgi:cytochrome c
MSCHSVDKKSSSGTKKLPRNMAARRPAKLIEKVKKGGSGVWGQVPMPPNSTVKDEDIKTLVKWVLAM